MNKEIRNPKYHLGDEIMFYRHDCGGGGLTVTIVKSIQYMDERTGADEWLYNNGTDNIYEHDIIRLRGRTYEGCSSDLQ